MVDIRKSDGLRIIKADDEKQIVFGIVLEPEVIDTQGDIISAVDVEKAAHNFAARYARGESQIGLDHASEMNRQDAILVETFLAPESFTQGGQMIRKGSWIIGVHIPDRQVWESVKDAERTGFSIGGSGEREPAVTKRDTDDLLSVFRDLADLVQPPTDMVRRTAYEALEAEADRLMKSAPALTFEQAFARVYKTQRDLRMAYEHEEAERKVRQLGGNGPTSIGWGLRSQSPLKRRWDARGLSSRCLHCARHN